LLLAPLLANWIAVVFGLYPYGRTRQCMFLAIFALTGVGVALARLANHAISPALGLAVLGVIICQSWGTLQGRDMLPLSEQRHEHMDQAMQLVHKEIKPGEVILTDKATSYQVRDYLCGKKPVADDAPWEGFDVFRCQHFLVLSTSSSDGALTASALQRKWITARTFPNAAGDVWIVRGGWASGLGEELQKAEVFQQIQVHTFGRYLEIVRLPGGCPTPAICIQTPH